MMRNPEIFGRAMVLSPSFYYVDENMYNMAMERAGLLGEHKIYFWVGGHEVWDSLDGTVLTKVIDFPKDMERMTAILEEAGFQNYKYRLDPSGNHNEFSWARTIPDAIKYLFID